jgi:hypothetical protein
MRRHTVKAVEANIDRTPLCPGCGKRMRLVQFSPKDDRELVLLSFGCRACGVSVTEEATRCALPQPAISPPWEVTWTSAGAPLTKSI